MEIALVVVQLRTILYCPLHSIRYPHLQAFLFRPWLLADTPILKVAPMFGKIQILRATP